MVLLVLEFWDTFFCVVSATLVEVPCCFPESVLVWLGLITLVSCSCFWTLFVLPIVSLFSMETSFTSIVILEFLSSYKTASLELFPVWVTVFLLLDTVLIAVESSTAISIPLLLTPCSNLLYITWIFIS